MISPSVLMIPTAFAVAAVTLRPTLLHSPLWRATVTPLASIIGSGFLVSGPVLAHVAGNWAWAAMLALVAAAYLIGSAIRSNILTVEPLLEGHTPRVVAWFEHASDLALAFAYFVSVTYYLNLLVAFGLRAGGIIDADIARWFSTVIIGVLGAIGMRGGLLALEGVESRAVGVKLALIGGLLMALAFAGGLALLNGDLRLTPTAHTTGAHEIGILLGLLILVQGFETSRYLGEQYDRSTRVKTMRFAQLSSAAVYVAFIVLITPYFTGRLPAAGGETAIIDMLAPLGALAAPLIIVAALASQLSAAVADMNGASGLLSAASRDRMPVSVGYLVVAVVAIGITWVADIFEIIVYASKAFALYYALQGGLAFLLAVRAESGPKWGRAAVFAGAALLSVLVLAFGVPAEGGT
jgi:hypothetical protein